MSEREGPRVTVLLPVYNGEGHLRESLESILSQTFEDFELLVIDDGSTDRSASILASCEDPRLRVVRNRTNIGLPRTLNRGIGLARGEFIARQDADDISDVRRLEKQVAFLDAHPEISLVGSAFAEIDSYGVVGEKVVLPTAPDEIRWDLFFYCTFIHSAVTIKRQVLRSVGGYDDAYAYAQDYELWTRLSKTEEMANLESCLVWYRVSDASMTSTHPDAASEPLSISVRMVSETAGWQRSSVADAEARFEDMQALYLSRRLDTPPAQSARAVQDLLHLHDRFCDTHGISMNRRKALRGRLRRRVGKTLLDRAEFARSKRDHAAARGLLGSALRLRPQLCLERRGMRGIAATLLGR